MEIRIRKANIEELDTLMEIYEFAKHFMETHGNQDQWTGEDAVTVEKVKGYIRDEVLYVGEDAEKIHFAFVYIQGEDPTYQVISDGAWLNDRPYGTIHRVASLGTARGVVRTISDWALSQNPNLKIDTHHDNLVMQNALARAGFTRCGIIYLENGDPRIAYQKVGSNHSSPLVKR